MHAFMYVSVDFEAACTAARDITQANRIIPFKLEKIDDTRQLIKLTNTSLAQLTTYVLERFDDASVEAQNAFLKRLEEPQTNLSFVLQVSNEANVLTTIASRCQVIRPQKNQPALVPDQEAEAFISLPIARKLQHISAISKREDAVAFLEKTILGLHAVLHTHPEYAPAIKTANETLDRIKKNANPSLQLTSFVLALN